jgi:pimeloyl-ACP methyl ester carboxylesterase
MAEKKDIVFVHGFLQSRDMWLGIKLNSSSRYKFHFVALPGHTGGSSELPDNISGYADAVLEVFENENIQNAFLIGHSMGGYCSLDFAKRFPEKVRALCLFHSTASEDSPQKKADRMRAIDLVRENKNAYNRTLITSTFAIPNREVQKERIQLLCENAETMTVESIVAAQNAMMNRQDSIEFLKNRSFPLFYFLGQRDELLSQEKMLAEVSGIPGAIAHFSDDVGHMGHYEDPTDAFSYLHRLLRAH